MANICKEIWKFIPNYSPYYKVSNKGNIKRVAGFNCKLDRPVKQYLNSRGYFKVILSKDNIQKNELVHRLVASAFIKNKLILSVVNHKNCNQTDNNKENLEWCTQRDNILHAIANGRRKNLIYK